MGFETPTPIQAQAIPVALANRDLIGCAQTGTGKTAAFSVPLVSKLEKRPGRMALVLTPTRELAAQIMEVVGKLTKHIPTLRSALLIGGAAMGPQERALARKPSILVATPGRLVDHLRRGAVSLSPTDFLVLDEADRMLDMGFAPQLSEILRFLPKTRQTMLFSATMPSDILKLASKYLKDPVRVTIGAASKPAEKVDQEIIHTRQDDKNGILLDQLDSREGSVLIFARTKRRTDKLAKFLISKGIEVNRIHGDRSQAQRNAALDGFKRGSVRILVATDVAARGIDVPHIAHVINYDMPQTAEDYIHRIGRTARAGAQGRALSLLTSEDKAMWKEITKLLDGATVKAASAAPPSPARDRAPIPAPARPAQQQRRRPNPPGGRSANGRPQQRHERRSGSGRPQGRPQPQR